MADGSVIIDTEIDQSGLKEGLAGLGKTLVNGITTAVAAAGAALVGLGAYSIKVGSDFEAAMSNVAATMGTSTDNITELTEKAKELGASTSFSATEAAEGLNILAQSGLNADEQLSTIGATLNLAAAGEMSMDEAAGYLTTTMKALNIEMDSSGKNATYVADLYAKGATLANTSTAEFGDAMQTASSVGGTYNQSLETMGTSLLALAEKGYQGSAAGNYLARAMSDLYAPTSQASAALEELGVKTYDEQGNQRDFIDIVNDLNAAFANLTEEEKANYSGTIFTTAGLKAFNAIAGNSSEQLANLKTSLSDCTGAAEQMANTKLDNLQGDITILQSATEGFGIAFYDVLNGISSEADEGTGMLRGFVQTATEIMGDLTTAVNENGFDGLADALGGALAKAVDKIVEYVPMLIEGGVNIVNSLVEGLTASAGNIADAATSLVSILVEGFLSITNNLVELAGELIIAFAEGLAANSDKIALAIMEGLAALIDTIVYYVPRVVTAAIEFIGAFVEGIIKALPTLIEAIPVIVQTLIDGLTECLPQIIECISSLVGTIAEVLPEIFEVIAEVIPQIIETVMGFITDELPTIINCIVDLVAQIVDALPDIIAAFVDTIPTLVEGIVNAIVTCLPQLVTAVSTLIQGIVDALPTIIEALLTALPQIITSVVSAITALLPVLIEGVLQLILGIVDALPTLIQTIVEALPQIITSIVDAIVAALPVLIEGVVALINGLAEALPDIMIAIAEALPDIISSIVNAIITLLPVLIEGLIQLVLGIVEALPKIITGLLEALPEIISAIIDGLITALPQLIMGLIQLILGIVEHLPEIITGLIEALPDIIEAIIEGLIECLPQLIEGLITLVVELVKHLPEIILALLEAIPTIISSIVEAFGGLFEAMLDVGKNMLTGLWNGICEASSWLWDQISGFCSDIWNGICNFFGIHSPSTLFRDMLGKNLILGLAEGVIEEGETAVDAMQEIADDIAGVQFKTGEVDFGDLSDKMYDAVTAEVASTGNDISSSSIPYSSYYSDESKKDGDESEEDGQGLVETNIYIDGKKFARTVTPYVAKELDWEDK